MKYNLRSKLLFMKIDLENINTRFENINTRLENINTRFDITTVVLFIHESMTLKTNGHFPLFMGHMYTSFAHYSRISTFYPFH